jgi:hypothetical protein
MPGRRGPSPRSPVWSARSAPWSRWAETVSPPLRLPLQHYCAALRTARQLRCAISSADLLGGIATTPDQRRDCSRLRTVVATVLSPDEACRRACSMSPVGALPVIWRQRRGDGEGADAPTSGRLMKSLSVGCWQLPERASVPRRPRCRRRDMPTVPSCRWR